jgi:hypothetical protein
MSLWSSFRASWRKGMRLRHISIALATPIITPGDLFIGGAKIEAAENELYDLVESDHTLAFIMQKHGAARPDLSSIYHTLVRSGAGGWTRGHWVAASAICYGFTLDFALSTLHRAKMTPEEAYNIWLTAGFELEEYFRKGRVSRV